MKIMNRVYAVVRFNFGLNDPIIEEDHIYEDYDLALSALKVLRDNTRGDYDYQVRIFDVQNAVYDDKCPVPTQELVMIKSK